MSALGVAEEYVVRIENTFTLPMYFTPGVFAAGNIEPIHDLPYSALSWGRVENDVSKAIITVANDLWGNTLCPYPLHGWTQSIGVYRNGKRVFWGPIVGWGPDPQGGDSVTIVAHDLFAFLKRATVYVDVNMVDVPAAIVSRIIQDIGAVASGSSPLSFMWSNMDPAYTDPDNYLLWGNPSTSRIIPRSTHVSAWTTIQDILAETGGTATAVGFVGYVKPRRVIDVAFQQMFPSLNEHTVLNKPRINVDCLDVASVFLVSNDNAGEGGYASDVDVTTLLVGNSGAVVDNSFYTLETVGLPGLYLPTYVPGAPRADDADALKGGYNPAIASLAPKTTMEQLVLRETFGTPTIAGTGSVLEDVPFAGINDLVPGRFVAKWGFDQDCLSAVEITTPSGNYASPELYHLDETIKFALLVQLDVNVVKDESGLTETIAASFVPMAMGA